MKKTIASLALAGLATLAFGQTAAPAITNQVDIGASFYGTDITGVYNNFEPSSYGQSGKYSPSLEGDAKYTFGLKLDDVNTIKGGLAYDGYFGLYSGSSNTTGESGQNAGIITPFVEYVGFGADVVASVPVYYFNPADSLGGINEFKYAYSEAGYMPTNTKSYAASSNNVIPNTELKANYKYSFDKTTWVLGQVDVLYTVSPTPWLTFVKPKVSAGFYGIQADVQYDFFNGYADASANQYYDTFLEPKLTYDLGFLSLVPGLKVYTGAKVSLITTNPAYNAKNFHSTWVQPGVNYTFAFDKANSFNIDAGWRFCKVDNTNSLGAANKGVYTDTTDANSKDVAPYSELRIIALYTVKF